AALVLAALAGCGQVSGIPVDATAARIANTVCPKAYMCCTTDQLAQNSSAGTDVASCETQTKQNYVNVLSTLQASVSQNRATYQSAQLDACLAKIMSSDCATLNVTTHLQGIPGCEAFTTPLVAVGGACSQNYECINGWCNVPQGGGDGVCAGFVPFGQSCALAGGPSCGPNAVCDPEGTVSDSSDDLCEPVSPNGGACLDDVQCQSLNCTSSGGSGMTCQAPATPPSMCFYQSGCSAAGGRPGPGTLVLFAVFVAVALARAGRARRNR
ncbi:MAG TPA: hypothetical protein VKZ18_08485, partial [Polyangia bacterium]|nr:hypothetical protein [Polyangia bacterium]